MDVFGSHIIEIKTQIILFRTNQKIIDWLAIQAGRSRPCGSKIEHNNILDLVDLKLNTTLFKMAV